MHADKLREVQDGHDGTWVAHPGLVPIAKAVFDEFMPGPNQVSRDRSDVNVTARDLLAVPTGDITEEGLRNNIRVGIQYLEAWLGGNGCVPLYNMMEDAATAEICRTQVWQWLRHGAKLDNGQTITEGMVRDLVSEEMAKLRDALGAERFDGGHFADATEVFLEVAIPPGYVEFLTLPAYGRVTTFVDE